MKKLILATILLSSITGCGLFSTKDCNNICAEKLPTFNSEFLYECEPLPTNLNLKTFEEVLTQKAYESIMYKKCMQSHNGLVYSWEQYKKEFINETK